MARSDGQARDSRRSGQLTCLVWKLRSIKLGAKEHVVEQHRFSEGVQAETGAAACAHRAGIEQARPACGVDGFAGQPELALDILDGKARKPIMWRARETQEQ